MNNKSIFQSNRKSTEKLQAIIHKMSEKELTRVIGNNWPIYIILAHIAFWDQRVIHVIELAKKNNELNAPSFDDQLNDILTPFLRVIPPTEAAKMAIRIASTLDHLLEVCPSELVEQMMKINNRLVDRSAHRNDHLNDIEEIINNGKNN